MDATGTLWKSQGLKGKLASGFTVSALPSGDKQSTLLSMFVFAMQHGMVWVGNAILPEHAGVPYDEAVNRLGSWSGLMAQAGHSGRAEGAFAPGDLKTARMFGANIAGTLQSMTCVNEAEAATRLPASSKSVLFGLILSGMMSLVGISTAVAGSTGIGFASLWAKSWLTAWVVAFPVVLLVRPLAQRLARALPRPR